METGEKKNLFLGLVGLLWLLGVVAAYAVTHKPFTPAQMMILLREGWQVLVVLAILSIAGGLGYRLFPFYQNGNALVSLVVQAALGFGLLALLILVMGITVGFSLLIFSVFLVLGFMFSNKHIFSWWQQWRALAGLWRQSGKFEKILASGIFFILFITFMEALAPPLAFDSLVYHLALPKLYLLAGRIYYVPELIFWGMPQQLEMGMTFAMSLGGTEAAVLLGGALGGLTLIGLLGYLSERFSSQAAWLAVIALLAGQGLSDLLSWGYVEWLVMLYGFSLLALLDMWTLSREKKLLRIAALLAGFALGTKYTAGILLVGGMIVIFFANRQRGGKAILRDSFFFVGIAILAFSPWLVKNFLATGSPVYPLLFPAGEMTSTRLQLYQGGTPWGDWRDAFFIPWRATIWGLDGKVGYSAEIGPLLLSFSTLAWMGWRERDEAQKNLLRISLTMTIAGFLIWALAGRTSYLLLQTRLYLAFFPAWAVLAGVGFESFSKLSAANVRFGRIAAVLVSLFFGFSLFLSVGDFARLGVVRTLLGAQSESRYREQALGTYETVMSAVAELSPDSHVVMLWETRGFACVPLCDPDEIIDRWYADMRVYGEAEAILDAWRKNGYTHVLYNKYGADFVRDHFSAYRDVDWLVLDDLFSQVQLVADFDGDYQLFSLIP